MITKKYETKECYSLKSLLLLIFFFFLVFSQNQRHTFWLEKSVLIFLFLLTHSKMLFSEALSLENALLCVIEMSFKTQSWQLLTNEWICGFFSLNSAFWEWSVLSPWVIWQKLSLLMVWCYFWVNFKAFFSLKFNGIFLCCTWITLIFVKLFSPTTFLFHFFCKYKNNFGP